MKKLILILGCFTAVVLTSCTADELPESQNDNSTATAKNGSVPIVDIVADGGDDVNAPKPKK